MSRHFIVFSVCFCLTDTGGRSTLEGGSCSSSGQPMAAGAVTSPTFTTRRDEPTEKKPVKNVGLLASWLQCLAHLARVYNLTSIFQFSSTLVRPIGCQLGVQWSSKTMTLTGMNTLVRPCYTGYPFQGKERPSWFSFRRPNSIQFFN